MDKRDEHELYASLLDAMVEWVEKQDEANGSGWDAVGPVGSDFAAHLADAAMVVVKAVANTNAYHEANNPAPK